MANIPTSRLNCQKATTLVVSSLRVIVLKSLSCKSESSVMVEVSWADRWQVYQRLQELAIPCSCAIDKPLQIQITDAVAAVQLWSVLRQLNTSRQDLVRWLENCWHT